MPQHVIVSFLRFAGGVKLRANKTTVNDGRRNSVARRRMEREAEEKKRAEEEEAQRMVGGVDSRWCA